MTSNHTESWQDHIDPPESEDDGFSALIALARFLRGPQGCPWDREHGSIDFARFGVEEAEELVEALESDDNDHAAEEWGDVFFVMLAAAAAAEAEGRFSIESALRRAHQKMIRRHAHVFSEDRAESPEEAVARWNAIKAQEKSGG